MEHGDLGGALRGPWGMLGASWGMLGDVGGTLEESLGAWGDLERILG